MQGAAAPAGPQLANRSCLMLEIGRSHRLPLIPSAGEDVLSRPPIPRADEEVSPLAGLLGPQPLAYGV
eukprot:337706-Alexandrium_andersonii.AAC.1